MTNAIMIGSINAAYLHARYYLEVLRELDNEYLRDADHMQSALVRLDREWAQIAHGQAWAVSWLERDREAANLCNRYPGVGAYLLDLRLNARERISWLESALVAARQLGKREAEGRHLGGLAGCYADLGNPQRAIELYEQRLSLAREIGDRRGEMAALGNLGNSYCDLGNLTMSDS